MEKKTFQVPNIGCNGCVNSIKGELNELDGVKSVEGVVDTKMVTVEYDSPASWDQIVEKLTAIEYPPATA
ncbi:heavy-metal-associated domain-containing protein [Phototrophicus methaneseepsis]|uniref:Heavy-metal-associated domain-containing protein n=1 Tax=Phototrophicus methaneseepsis TaxID=2710758 RepID=A0A7S8IDR3_9CHLR|nr:heavy-metal-associated domain-containing protein [Phototrophicus methaneseepsis]QPC81811.1 heavy-metal-associated domain-containing protein [Phototrophicus methaneseepsis]